MGRKPLPIDAKKQLFNCKLSPEDYQLLRVICFRRSIHQGKKFSEGQYISEQIRSTAVPAPTTVEERNAFVEKYPIHKKWVAGLLKLPVPKISEPKTSKRAEDVRS